MIEQKTGFMRKEACSYIQMAFIVLLATNSSKQRKDNQCLAHYQRCLLRVYHNIDLFTIETKAFSFFDLLVNNYISPYF